MRRKKYRRVRRGIIRRKNPCKARKARKARRAVLIYPEVHEIIARKCDNNPDRHIRGRMFTHKFKSRPKMYGMPNGDILITHRRLS